MSVKQRLPFLRWSTWRLAMGMPSFLRTGQIGDGREAACADYVESHARRGDVDDVLAAIDSFAYEKAMLVNVGDEKGELLDAAVRRAAPGLALELGTYCGYSALRIARAAPHGAGRARSSSLPPTPKSHGVSGRTPASRTGSPAWSAPSATAARTLDALAAEHGFAPGSLDLLFIDHDKRAYLSDLLSVLDRGWLHPGSIVVADNVRVPGAPKYRAYMREQQGTTVQHRRAQDPRRVPDPDARPGARVGVPGLAVYRARGCAPAHTSRSAFTVTIV